MSPLITTSRLLLREMCESDLEFLADLLADPEVMYAWPRPLTRDEAIEWIERQQNRYTEDGCGYWLALDCESGEPVGQVGVIMSEIDDRRETTLGWIIAKHFQNRGYATEGARAAIDWAWANRVADRLIAPIRPNNTASIAVARKLGMSWEKCVPFHDLDHDIYVITRP